MTATELVSTVKSLPPVPHTALRLVKLLDQASVSNDDIVELIRQDTVLTAKLLRACNSSAFGFSDPISSVDQAVLILGHQQIFQLVLTLAFGSSMNVSLPGYAVEASQLWQHSLTAAMAAEVIARSDLDLQVESSVAFTSGLLHDLGKLAMNSALTAEVQADIRERIAQGMPSVEAEHAVIGTDHADVGACLLKTWNLPDEIVEAVANHHHPVVAPRPRLSVVAHLADCVTHMAGASPGWDAFAVQVDSKVVARVGITQEKLEAIVVSVHDASESVNHFMSIK